ncbi:MAG: hypothetical protein J5949_05980, partial [Oscillospiraceae bacterium]|nr:hypothetical protein [Oscillospiraceae bacterium]
QGLGMIAAMFRFKALPAAAPLLARLSTPAASGTLCAALALVLSSDGGRIHAFLTEERAEELVPDLCCLLLLALSVMSLAQSGFHPFIYFQF